MRAFVRFVAVRTAALALLNVLGSAVARLVDGLTGRADANIGLGLLLLGALVLAASGWAWRDGIRAGRRGRGLSARAAGWMVVAVLVAVAGAVWISVGAALSGGGFDPEVLRGDVWTLTPFQALLVGLPALLLLMSGYQSGDSRRRPQVP